MDHTTPGAAAPREVFFLRLVADYHTHTVYSHGKGTVADNARAAARAGLAVVGISDHGPANLFGVGVRGPHVFDKIREEARRWEREGGRVRVLVGVEANVVSLDGRLDLPDAVLQRLDYVMAGLHVPVKPLSWRDAARFTWANVGGRLSRRLAQWARELNTEALVAAVLRNRVDVVTHPGWRLSIDTRELARACARRGTALEINTGHVHTDVPYIEAAAAEGVHFVIGSDAHTPARVGDLASGLELARRAGLTEKEIVNAEGYPGRRPGDERRG